MVSSANENKPFQLALIVCISKCVEQDAHFESLSEQCLLNIVRAGRLILARRLACCTNTVIRLT